MAKNKTTDKIPVITTPKTSGKSTAICKLSIRKTPVDNLTASLTKLLADARDAGHKPISGRGTITLY